MRKPRKPGMQEVVTDRTSWERGFAPGGDRRGQEAAAPQNPKQAGKTNPREVRMNVLMSLVVAAAGILVLGWAALQQQPAAPVVPMNLYADSCVVEMTHPELEVVFLGAEGPCGGCLYTFCVVNRTGGKGTYAGEVRVDIYHSSVRLAADGETIPVRRLDGYVDRMIQPVNYPLVRLGEPFQIEAPCPSCLRAE